MIVKGDCRCCQGGSNGGGWRPSTLQGRHGQIGDNCNLFAGFSANTFVSELNLCLHRLTPPPANLALPKHSATHPHLRHPAPPP
jgi:hypothetical protein